MTSIARREQVRKCGLKASEEKWVKGSLRSQHEVRTDHFRRQSPTKDHILPEVSPDRRDQETVSFEQPWRSHVYQHAHDRELVQWLAKPTLLRVPKQLPKCVTS